MNSNDELAGTKGRPVPHWDVNSLGEAGDMVGGDYRYIRLNGTLPTLRKRGIDPGPNFSEAPEDAPQVVRGIDGNDWHVWGQELFFYAQRERTAAEMVAQLDRMNGRIFSGYFSKDRMLMCMEMAEFLSHIAYFMEPEKQMPRSSRRRLKQVLKTFAEVQLDLTFSKKVDMQAHRESLGRVGLAVRQIDLVGIQAAAVH